MMTDIRKKKLFLLDMDGTLYLGDRVFDRVAEFLQYIRKSGGRFLYLTNNSSRGVEGYLRKLHRLGLPAEKEDFLTSVDATIACLEAEYPGRKCYVMGTRSFYQQLQDAHIPVCDALCDDARIVLCGYDTELTYQKLMDACILLRRGLPWLATNPDWVCPTERGPMPDCGSVCQMLSIATERAPRFIGKPQPEMVRLALARTGFPPEEAVVIGDRIYTDIACGVNAGVDTVFVLSGEGVMSDTEKYKIHPTWTYDNIAALLQELEG